MRSISFLSHVVCTYICFLTVPAYVQAFSIGATSHHGTVSISPCKEEEGTWQFNFAQRCARRGAVHSNLSCLCSVKSNQKCDSCAKPVTSLQMLSTNRHHSPIVECTSIKNRSLFMSTNELQNELREGERSTFFQRIFRVFLQSLIALKVRFFMTSMLLLRLLFIHTSTKLCFCLFFSFSCTISIALVIAKAISKQNCHTS